MLDDWTALFVKALDPAVAITVAFVLPAIMGECRGRNADGGDCEDDLPEHGCISFRKPRSHWTAARLESESTKCNSRNSV
jgi:hypothetical protein